MKTMEQLFNEVMADQKLKDEAVEAVKAGKLADFLKAHDCKASKSEVIAFLKVKAKEAGIPSYVLDLL